MDFGESDIFRLSSESEEEAEAQREGVEGEGAVALLHQAVSRGDTGLLVQVVQTDPSLLEQRNHEGMTPLAQAVASEQMTAVKRLVKMGADINAQDGMGRTALSVAAYQGWLEGVVYLLRNGARQSIADKTGRLPLHAATYHSDPRTLETLLQSSSTADINQTDHEQMTAVHWAAFHRRPEHVRCLIERGASLLQQDMDGKLPLHWAAQNGCQQTCHLLLHASTLRQHQGEKAGGGVGGGVGERERMLRAHDHSGKTALHFAAAAGRADVIRQLASYPACRPDCSDPDDRNPLHWAAVMGHAQCVQALLDLGVDAKIKDVDGGTPLSYAQQSGHADCVHALEEALHLAGGGGENGGGGKGRGLEGGGGGGGGRGGGRKGRSPLELLKGLFHSYRKDGGSGRSPSNPSLPLVTSPCLPTSPSQDSLSSSPAVRRLNWRREGGGGGLSLPSIHGTVPSHPSHHSEGGAIASADVTGSAASSLPPSDVSPKTGGEARQLDARAAGRLHDGMVSVQRNATDMRPPDLQECPSPSPSPRRHMTSSPPPMEGKSGKVRGPPPPSSLPLSQQQQQQHHSVLTSRDVLSEESRRRKQGRRKGGEVGQKESLSLPQAQALTLSLQATSVPVPLSPRPPTCAAPQLPSARARVSGSGSGSGTLPPCSGVPPPLLRDSGGVSRSPRVPQRQSSMVSLPQCSSVPLALSSSSSPSHSSQRDVHRASVVSSSTSSRLPDPSSFLPCSSSSSSLVGKDRTHGTHQKSDLKLVDI